MTKRLTCQPSSDKSVFGFFANEELKALLKEARKVVKQWAKGDENAKVKAFELDKKLEEQFGYFLHGGAETPKGFMESIEQITCIELHNHQVEKVKISVGKTPNGEIWVVG